MPRKQIARRHIHSPTSCFKWIGPGRSINGPPSDQMAMFLAMQLLTQRRITIRQCLNRPFRKSSPSKKQPTFRFMELPVEIRNRIYPLMLEMPRPSPGAVTIIKRAISFDDQVPSNCWQWQLGGDSRPNRWEAVDCPNLDILRVSKQIYTEAFHLFYKGHTLGFPDTGSLYDFLRDIGPKRRQQLTSIFLNWQGPEAEADKAFKLLRRCPNLKSIILTMPCNRPKGYWGLCEVRGVEVNVCAMSHRLDVQQSDRKLMFFARSDKTCGNCHWLAAQGVALAKGLVWAMQRPRLKRYRPDPELENDLLKPTSFKKQYQPGKPQGPRKKRKRKNW